MERDFADILKQIGVTDGLHVPVANEENKQLQKEVEEKLRCKADLIMKLEMQKDQNQRIQKQIENLKVQKEQNQQLLAAFRNQRETELSMLKDSEFNLSKTLQDIRDKTKQIHESEQKQNSLKEDIKRSMKKLDHLKSLVEWGQEARNAWQEELDAGEKDNSVLERFKLEDDAKFKEMELKRQRLKADVMEREAILTNELNMLATLENQLEQVSRLFRRAHNERMSLISYWENAVKILNQRDNNIDSTLQEIHNLKEMAQEKFNVLAEERKFYETQCENNEELTRQLDELNSKVVHHRQINMDLSNNTNDLRNEVATLRGVMSQMGNAINNERSRNSHLKSQLQAKQAYHQSLRAPIADLQKRLKELSEEDLTSAQKTKELDEILKAAEKDNDNMKIKVDKLSEKVFEKTKVLDSLKGTSRVLAGELKFFDTNKLAFEKRSAEIEKETINKEQMLYELEMELVTLESKLQRLQGERSDEEKIASKTKILELEENLRKKTELMNLVNLQYNKVKNEQTRLTNAVEEETEQLRKLAEKRQELMFLVEGGRKQLLAQQNTNKQLQVTLNLLKLRVDQREKMLAQTDSQVYGLEREKLELDNALRDRKVEIGLQMDLMSAKKRTLEEEKSELKKALEHLRIRVSQLQKKHDIVMDLLGKEHDGDNFSVAHFKIKLAQERHELQEIGDELDSKIKKAENEIPAMENTLRVISAANDCYKRNLDAIDSNSPEMQQKKTLELELEHAVENLRERQNDLKELTSHINELEFSLSQLADDEERVQTEWRERDIAARALDKELEEQQNKLLRADRLLRKIKKEARQAKEGRIALSLAEKDIELRELQDINQSALQQLAELSTRYSEVAPLLNRYLDEKGLTLPMVRTSRNKAIASSSLSHRSLISEDSHTTWPSSQASGMSSQTPSIVLLDPDTIDTARKVSGDKLSKTFSGRKKSK